MNNIDVHGIIVPLLTPIFEDETVNYSELETLINYVIDGGVDAIFSMGSSGEFARFDADTRFQVMKETVGIAAGRVPVYAGVSDAGLKSALQNIKLAEAAGVDVLVSTLPYYFPIRNDEEGYVFFSRIAEETKLPIMLYNIPSTCLETISLELIDRLRKYDNIIGIKDSSGNEEQLLRLLRHYKDEDFAVVVGAEELSYIGLISGAKGLVPSMANPFPKLFAQLYHAAIAGDEAALKACCNKVNEMNCLNQYCDAWMSPNVWRKKALEMMKICSSNMTMPYVSLKAEDIITIQSYIDDYLAMG